MFGGDLLHCQRLCLKLRLEFNLRFFQCIILNYFACFGVYVFVKLGKKRLNRTCTAGPFITSFQAPVFCFHIMVIGGQL